MFPRRLLRALRPSPQSAPRRRRQKPLLDGDGVGGIKKSPIAIPKCLRCIKVASSSSSSSSSSSCCGGGGGEHRRQQTMSSSSSHDDGLVVPQSRLRTRVLLLLLQKSSATKKCTQKFFFFFFSRVPPSSHKEVFFFSFPLLSCVTLNPNTKNESLNKKEEKKIVFFSFVL